MFRLCFVVSVLVTLTIGAPSCDDYFKDSSLFGNSNESVDDFFKDDGFDTQYFWDAVMKLHSETVDQVIKRFGDTFQTNDVHADYDGDKYKITVKLDQFVEEDIVVTAKKNTIIIQAVHRTETSSLAYTTMLSLPDDVNSEGEWSFTNNLLTIQLPVRKDTSAVTEVTNDINETTENTESNDNNIDNESKKNRSREKMEPNSDIADVNAEIEMNANNIDDTTSVYKFKPDNDVELVTVRYNRSY